MAKAKQLPSGAWRVQVYSHSEIVVQPDGSTKKVPKYESITADTEDEANFLAADYRLKRNGNAVRRNSMTVLQAMDDYIRIKGGVLSGPTIRGYKGIRNNHFVNLRDISILKLTTREIQAEISREAAQYTPKTVKNAYGFLTAVLDEYRPGFNPRVRLPQREKREILIPTRDEIITILDRVKGTELEIPVMLGAFCGMRRSEICALDYADIRGGRVSINKALVRDERNNWVIKNPKSYAGARSVEVPQFVVDTIGKGRGRIVHINPDALTLRFMRLTKAMGCDIHFHALRHYYASILVSLGVPDKYAMQRMGHATNAILRDVYQHIIADKDKEIAEQITGYFSDVLK